MFARHILVRWNFPLCSKMASAGAFFSWTRFAISVGLTAQLEIRFWPVTWLVVRITWWLIVIHLVEIALWALFFWWQKCLPDAESSFYFSGVTYATIGYGDLVLPKEWRLFGQWKD